MKELLRYVKNNPLYLVAWIILIPVFLHVLWVGIWPLVYVIGFVMIGLVVVARRGMGIL